MIWTGRSKIRGRGDNCIWYQRRCTVCGEISSALSC